MADLAGIIVNAWEARSEVGPGTRGEVRDAVDAAIAGLDGGTLRVAEKRDGEWIVHQWLKMAVLLSFRLHPNRPMGGGPDGAIWWDKVSPKFAGWGPSVFEASGIRAVPGAIVRRGAYVAPGAVLAMGVFLGASTKVIDRETGAVHMGRVPPYSVVVPGTLPGRPLPDGTPGPHLACAVIVKTVDARTRSKTAINDLLRD